MSETKLTNQLFLALEKKNFTKIFASKDRDYASDNDSLQALWSDNEDGTSVEEESLFASVNLKNAALIFFYSLIIVISLFGNSFVIRVLCKAQLTTTNMLIINLAISDLLLTCFNIPINVVRFVSRDWIFGKHICHLTPFIQSLSAHTSSITMMVIAFERYKRLIGFNFKLSSCWRRSKAFCCSWCRTMSQKHSANEAQSTIIIGTNPQGISSVNVAQTSSPVSVGSWWTIVYIWCTSATLSLPYTFHNRMVVFSLLGSNMVRCITHFSNEQHKMVIAILSPITQYLLPIGLTMVFYFYIGCFLWKRSNPVGMVSDEHRKSLLQRKQNRVKMLWLVVLVFATCWLPLHIYVMLIDFKVVDFNFDVYFTCHWIAVSSSCYNPFIYCWLNESFRNKTKRFVQVFTSIRNFIQRALGCCCLRKTESIPASNCLASGTIITNKTTASVAPHQSSNSAKEGMYSTLVTIVEGGNLQDYPERQPQGTVSPNLESV